MKMTDEEKKMYESMKVVYDYIKKNDYISLNFDIKDSETGEIRHLHVDCIKGGIK